MRMGRAKVKRTLTILLVGLMAVQQAAFAATAWPADVAKESWSAGAVEMALAGGWLPTSTDGLFRPEKPATREFVALLLTQGWPKAQAAGRVAKALPEAGSDTVFTDLDGISPQGRDALLRLNGAGVLTGYPQGTLKPEGLLTRLEMAVILTRLVGEKAAAAGVFADEAAVPDWGKTAMRTVAAAGLMKGYSDGSFKPDVVLTRAEALTLTARWIGGPTVTAGTQVSRGTVSLDSYSAEILKLVNAERGARGLSPLQVNRTLTTLAKETAAGMADSGSFSHISPSGEDTAARFARYGFVNQAVGENMLRLKGSVSAATAVKTWMGSESHRAIILTPYTDTGIGISKASDGTLYITQTFASL